MISKYTPTQEELDFAMSSMPVIEQRKISLQKSKYAPTEEEMDFANESMNMPVQQEIPWYKSYPASLGKGLVKGVVQLGEMFGGLHIPENQRVEEEDIRASTLEHFLPSNEGKVEETLERSGKILPSIASGGAGIIPTVVRAGSAAIAGQTAKEAGFGETGQAVAETLATLTPKFSKNITPTKAQKEIVQEARRLGLSEKELVPLVQSEKKQKILSKFASRGEDMQDILKGSKKAVDNLYNVLEQSPNAKNAISDQNKRKLMIGFKDKFENLPDELRKKIAPDFHDLINGEITGDKLINFWQDLNHHIKKGNTKLGTLKDPILKAMDEVSPEFAKDFQSINKLYQNSAKIRQRLNPRDEGILSKLLSKTAPYRAIAGFITGYQPLLIEALGEVAGKSISKNMLTNPRLQNIGVQMMHAASENKIQLAKNLKEILKKESRNEEFSEILDEIDFSIIKPD